VLFLTVRAEIGRAIAFRRAFDGMRVAFAWFAFALVDAKNAFDSLKPPLGVAEIGSGIEAKLQRAAQDRDDCFIECLGFVGFQRVREPERAELRVPKSFARVDVANAGDVRLIEKKFFERAARLRNQPRERVRGELGRHRVDAEFVVGRARGERWPRVNAAEMPAVREGKDAFVEFQGDVDVNAGVGLLVCARVDFLCVRKVNEMPVESEMHFDRRAVVEHEKQIFPFALNGVDTATGEEFRDVRRRLRQHGDRMENFDAANFARLDERPQ
jgi:hypothetical protein